MVILAVDDERIALEGMCGAIREVVPECELHAFIHGGDALEFAKETPVDAAFLDIQLRGINGVEIAKRLKAAAPKVNIVFTTGYDEYRREAFDLHASGYVMKPVTAEKIRREMEDLRHPVPPFPSGRLRIQAFGDFEAYWNNEPVKFHYSKTKELLAYLVDRKGALCSKRSTINALWEEIDSKGKTSYFQNIRIDLIHTVQRLGCGDVIVCQPGKLGVRADLLECDYYDWIAGKPSGLNAFRGEYMSQYSWGEYTLGQLAETAGE